MANTCSIHANLKTMQVTVSDTGAAPALQDILVDLPSMLAALDVVFLYALGKQWISGDAQEQSCIDVPAVHDLPTGRVELGFDVNEQYWVRCNPAGT